MSHKCPSCQYDVLQSNINQGYRQWWYECICGFSLLPYELEKITNKINEKV